MNRGGHASTGAASGALVGVTVSSGPLAALICTGIGGIAALWPDIDHRNSTITTTLGPVGTPLSWIARKASLGVYTITATSKDTPEAGGSHRGLTHTAVAGIAAGAAVWALLAVLGVGDAAVYGLATAVGIVTHIAGDALTATGVPLLWPIKIRGERWYACRMPLITITGGGRAETLLTGMAWAATVALLTLSVADLSHTDLLA